MKKIIVKTRKKKEVVDITDLVNEFLSKQDKTDGICHLFALHTSSALSTAVLDPGTDLDMLEAYDAMVPELNYRHPHDPSHVPDHILTSLMGTSLAVPVKNKRVVLGQWQRIALFEFDGPREREVAATMVQE